MYRKPRREYIYRTAGAQAGVHILPELCRTGSAIAERWRPVRTVVAIHRLKVPVPQWMQTAAGTIVPEVGV